MSSWTELELEQCLFRVEIPNKIQRKDFLETGEYPVISQEMGLINGYWDKKTDLYKIGEPLVIFGDHTKVLKFVDFDFVVGADGVKILQPKVFLDAKYLYYFLMGSPVKSLGYARHYRLLKTKIIRFPPIAEQKRIVALLDEAFTGLDAAIANTTKNLANSRELLDGALQKVFMSMEEGSYTRYSLAELLERSYVLGHLDGNHGSDYPRKEEFMDTGVPYISANCIADDEIDLSRAKFLTASKAETIRKGIAKNRDVIFAHNATVGPVAMLHMEHEKAVLGTSLTYYRCNESHIVPEYLANFMRSPVFKRQYHLVMRQSTRNQVPITTQREFYHFIPSLETQIKVAGELDFLREQVRELDKIFKKKLNFLAELKNVLLHQAFTGQLTEKSVEDAIA